MKLLHNPMMNSFQFLLYHQTMTNQWLNKDVTLRDRIDNPH